MMDNTGKGPLRVPGFNDIPLYFEFPRGDRFAHGFADWSQNPRLTAREVAMLRFMEAVTDEPEWENEVTNRAELDRWRSNAFYLYGLSQQAWDWCQAELQDKAEDFKRTGYVMVFDADSRVCKSDTLVEPDLRKEIRDAFGSLVSSTPADGGQRSLRQLVDPSMYPLVYGSTRALTNGGAVGLELGNWDEYKHCQIAPVPVKPTGEVYEINQNEVARKWDDRRRVKPDCWSTESQWLPCEVSFEGDMMTPRITSYINNIHPNNKGAYKAIERLIGAAIAPWNEMPILGRQGRTPIRIRTYNYVEENKEWPTWISRIHSRTLRGIQNAAGDEEWDEICSKVKEYLTLPDYPRECRFFDEPDYELLARMAPEDWESPEKVINLVQEKWCRRYVFHYPEPGISFTYADWKAGRNTGRAILPKYDNFSPDRALPQDPDHQYYSISLQERFRTDGLQIIVQVTSIDLTPDRPSYAGDQEFHVAGMLNEHIVATAVYYYEVDNIIDAKISFEQEAVIDNESFNVKNEDFINRVWDIPDCEVPEDDEPWRFPQALQTLGAITISSGRFLAWPNTLRSKAESFSLEDPSRPGRLRFVTLWLVDPHYRICSTRNVPPQRHDWAAAPSERSTGDDYKTFMTPEQAQEVRERTTAERKSATEKLNNRALPITDHFARYTFSRHFRSNVIMGKEQPGELPGVGAGSTAHHGPRESAVDELSSSKEAAHHARKDGEDDPTNEAHNANPGKELEAGTLSRTTTEQGTYISGLKLALVWLPLSLVVFVMLLDVSIVATAIPRITSDFHSLTDVGWYGSAYLLANCALQPLAGKLYTHFGSKGLFLGFFALFELGSLLCGVATSSKMLIIGRAVAGMGGAGLVNGALTIISCSVPLHKRPAYMGAMMGIGQMGVVIGPLIGGAFTEYTTWRWCFYINLPIGGVVAILFFFTRIPDTDKSREISVLQTILTKLDLIGFALFAPATIQLLLALDYGGNKYAWNSATVIGLFCGAGGTFIVFLIWEYFKGEEAMVPLSMLKQRGVWSSCFFAFFFFATLQLVIYYLPIYFQAIKGASPMMSGVDLLPNILSQLVGTLFSGVAVTKMGYYLPFVVAASIITTVGHGMLSTLSPTSSTGKWIGYQIIVGFGRGLGLQMPFVAVQNTLPPFMVSISMSLLTFLQTLGGALFLTFGQTIFTNSLRSTIPTYASGVNPEAIVQAGATGLRAIVTNPSTLAGVLVAYSKSIDRVFYLTIGCSGVAFLFAWGMGWKDIRKKSKTKDAQKEEV
ncbi:hypothetical protein CNMCM6106_006298 [Aspergillus hiratsukae]|uniref:Major facilitator superfamily (MFS) profile domain-containing protein n=1 Tax=Aspergillus hiratsukae TaxID=1194566 RepID=A0A8H6PQL6_9EURO|nr:hypothetical protein CNMCM6106_006298 [Aspergillus hiratsukae]